MLNELIQTVRKPSVNEQIEFSQVEDSSPLPKSEPPPVAKPLNKTRINEFATLLSSSVHLTQTPTLQKPATPKTNSTVVQAFPSPPNRSEDQSFASIRSANSEKEEKESFHTVHSNPSDSEFKKKQVDASYNEKLDDRGSIQIKTANIKALFEQKISDTHKATAQSNENSNQQSTETRQHHHKKIPVSFDSLRRNIPSQVSSSTINRRTPQQDSATMNKYTDHVIGAKEVVIEDKPVGL